MSGKHRIADDPADGCQAITNPNAIPAAALVYVLTGRELSELRFTRHDGTQRARLAVVR